MTALNPELMKLMKNAKNKYSHGNKAISLKEGKTVVRILPAKDGGKFWEELGVHWIKTEKDGKPVAVVGCKDVVHEEPCEICTAIAKAAEVAKAAYDDDALEIIKEWGVKKRVLFNALIRSGTDASEAPQVLDLTPTTASAVWGVIAQYQEDDINVLDPATGMDFIIERTGKGLNTKYTVMPAPKSKPVPKDALDKLVDLKAYIEKEFFRGEETKAIKAIATFSGVAVGAIAGPKTGTALLTSTTADDVEALEAAEELVSGEETAAEPEPAVEEDDEEARLMKQLEEARAKKAAEKAAAAKPAAKPAAEKPASKKVENEFGADMSESDIDDMLADLETK